MENQEEKNNKILFAEKENRLRSKAAILDSYFLIMNEGMECYTKYKQTGTISTPLQFKWIQGCRSLLYQVMKEEKKFYEKYKDKEKLNDILSDIEQLHDFSLELIQLETVDAMRELSKEELDAIEQYKKTAYK